MSARRITLATVVVTSLVLLGGMLGSVPATATPSSSPTPSAGPGAAVGSSSVSSAGGGSAAQTSADKKQDKKKKKKNRATRYTPNAGIRFNNPLGNRASRRKIISQVIKTIDAAQKRNVVRIASWNIRSNDITDRLIAAHRRGVTVQVIMDRGNANKTTPNDTITRLAKGLRGDAKRKPAARSWVKKCASSCRGRAGIAHTKFFLFSKAGKAKNIVIYGSNNATDLAAYGQWNDVYTLTNSASFYREFTGVFKQMQRDRAVKQGYLTRTHGRFTSYYYPYTGGGTSKDPVLTELNKISCTGATGGTGTNGRTKIRIAQTSMHGDRGKKIATRIRTMWQRGCDIKIVYAVFGNEVLSILRHTSRGAVPIRQIAQDFNLDGVYDKYLHMKNMSVSGVYNGKTNVNVTWNGSANWTSVALASDEIVMRIYGSGPRVKYSRWVDYLYAHPPRFTGKTAVLARYAKQRAIARGIDPESGIEVN